jgi:hypothetical protein
MMSEQGCAAAPSWTLRVSLLICAGALIVIFMTMASTVSEAHSVQASQDFERFCGMSMRQYNSLPTSVQYHVNAQCVAGLEEDR